MKNKTYDFYKEFLKNKDKNTQNYIEMMFNKTNEMFSYKNLPSEIPQKQFEYLLQFDGKLFFTKHNEKFYFFRGAFSGEINEYSEYTDFMVNVPILNLNKEYKIGVDGVLIKNNTLCNSMLDVFSKYGVMLCDNEITLDVITILNRIPFLISSNDDKTKKQAEIFIEKINNGDYSIIGSNQFFDGIKVDVTNTTQNAIRQFIELHQYLKASAFNEIGLNANYNMKKERMTSNDLAMSIDVLIPLSENMLNCRKQAINAINEKYGLNIEVELNSVWENNLIEMESETTQADNNNDVNSLTDKTDVDDKTDVVNKTDIDDKTDVVNKTNIDDKGVKNE